MSVGRFLMDCAILGRFPQPIFMVQTLQDRLGQDVPARRKLVTVGLGEGHRSWFWNGQAWSKTAMWTAVIVMGNPLRQNLSQVSFAERNHEVQANQSFTIGIGLRCSDRRSQDFQTQILYGLIHFFGEDAVPIMDQEAIAVIARNGFAELLRCPLCCGMCGHIAMKNLPRTDLQDD